MSIRNAVVKSMCSVVARPILLPFWSNVSLVSRYFEGLGSGSTIDRSGEIGVIDRIVGNPHIPKTFIDAGANIGGYTAQILALCPFAKVHSFDASPFAVRKLKERFKQNDGVTVMGMGLSDKTETLTLRSPTKGSGVATYYEHLDENIESFTTVECTTLDDYCEKTGLIEIGLLKVDVEGHEL